MSDFNVVIVGGGIAGLMSAYRFARRGMSVCVVEARLLGDGATGSNQGIIHSGAIYSHYHPEVARLCSKATLLFRRAFEGAQESSEKTLHLVSSSQLPVFCPLWERDGIEYQLESSSSYDHIFRPGALDCFEVAAISCGTVCSQTVTADLTQRLLKLGVEILVNVPVQGLRITAGRVRGVRLGRRESIDCNETILAAGAGLHALWRAIDSRGLPRLRSRTDMIVIAKGNLQTPLAWMSFGHPYLVPRGDGVILASRHGGTQHWLNGPYQGSVPTYRAEAFAKTLRGTFQPDVVDCSQLHAYTCTKTELESEQTDRWGVDPLFRVVDHAQLDGISHLWSIIPGKMTLAFHATRALVASVLADDEPLELPPSPLDATQLAHTLIAEAPWQALPEGMWAPEFHPQEFP